MQNKIPVETTLLTAANQKLVHGNGLYKSIFFYKTSKNKLTPFYATKTQNKDRHQTVRVQWNALDVVLNLSRKSTVETKRLFCGDQRGSWKLVGSLEQKTQRGNLKPGPCLCSK